MTITVVALHEDPSTFLILLLRLFYYFEIANNFLEKMKAYLIFSAHYNTLLQGKNELCDAI